MPTDLRLRPATPADAEAVAATYRALSRDEGGPPSRFTAAAFRRDGFGAEPAFRCLLAERDGAVVGYALYYPDYDTDRLVRSVYLADLYVENTARRRGVGGALMAAVARAGRGHGAEAMHWSVMRSNARARRFYRRYGRELDEILICWTEADRLRALAASPKAPGVRIRAARPTDAPLLAEMLRALVADLGEPPPTEIRQRLSADGFGDEPAFACLIAERDSEAVGYALAWDAYDTDSCARGTFLSDLYVAPRARRAGLGRTLMAAAAGRALTRGGDFMVWEVLMRNAPARAFYRPIADELDDVIACISGGAGFAALAGD
ncbi:MAG TPA: GNAT family N-acetyltransferase [Dongiaceae bacterium]|nr:GNAT family N-acetyltransferase [Dongiaceae bacterium]